MHKPLKKTEKHKEMSKLNNKKNQLNVYKKLNTSSKKMASNTVGKEAYEKRLNIISH